MSMLYLRGRPFLVINVIHSAAKGTRTERKGWHLTAENWQSNDAPSIVDRVSKKILENATVIIDLVNNKLIKNRYQDNSSEEILKHFTDKYPNEIAQVIAHWKATQPVVETPVEATESVEVVADRD